MKRVFKFWQKLLGAPKEKEIRIIQFVAHLLLVYSVIRFPILTFYGFLWGWLISGLGGVLIGHRYAAHKQFEFPNNFIKYFFYTLYNLNTIGSAVNYANIHWLHHQYSDDLEKDPTTWKRTGIIATHFTFYGFNFSGKFKIRRYKTLMKDSANRFFHNYYFAPHLVFGIILLFFGYQYFLAFLVVPAVICFHIAQFQVGILHVNLPGAFRKYKHMEAYNIPWLKPLLFGEELHNNHHANPNDVNRGEGDGIAQFDPLYRLVIKPFFRVN